MKSVQIPRPVLGKAWFGIGAAAQIVVVAAAVSMILSPAPATAKTPEACAALQAKYPSLKGKTLVNAVNPHTPGYEAIDPKDPSKYVGFDIDLGEAIGDCLGFKLDLQAGDLRGAADDAVERPGRHRDLRHLCHQGARQGGRLHHLFEGV